MRARRRPHIDYFKTVILLPLAIEFDGWFLIPEFGRGAEYGTECL